MKTSVIVGLVLAGFLSIAAILGGSYISAHNYGNRAEKQIVAEYTDMENILGQYSLKVKEVAQVPGMMTDDLKEVIKAGMTGRYGEDGSKAMFQWITENYPGKVDPAVYIQIQQVMEAGRNKFENAQRKFIDVKKGYETNLGYFWRGTWLSIAGYPKIKLEDYQIISSTVAKKAFSTGIDEVIIVR